jgi:hypothetical protein
VNARQTAWAVARITTVAITQNLVRLRGYLASSTDRSRTANR